MPVTVAANNLTVVHAGSDGVTIAFPDVCKTPAPPAPPIPIPYPNIAKSADTAQGAKTVTCDGSPVCVKDSNFMMSVGDDAGSAMGVASNKVKGKAEFVNFSFDVLVEGKNVPRAMDLMLHNDKNTPPAPLMQPPLPAMAPKPTDKCTLCGENRGGEGGGGGTAGAGGAGGASGTPASAPAPSRSTSSADQYSESPAPAVTNVQSRIVNVEWGQDVAWCGQQVHFAGDVEGAAKETKVPARIEIQSGGSPLQSVSRVSWGRHQGSWFVKDVLPPIEGGHPAKTAKLDVSVAGARSTVPLTIRFAPSLEKYQYVGGYYHRFSLTAEDFKISVGVDVKNVKGWGAEIVKLGKAVPRRTGGLIDGFPYEGYRWMAMGKAGKRLFWDATRWRDLPNGFQLTDANSTCVGIVQQGQDYVCVEGGKWPARFVDWDPDDPARRGKIAAWVRTIESTWSGKFALRRRGCGTRDSACCRYQIATKARFERAKVPDSSTIVLAYGNVRSNTSLFFIDDPDLAMAAHEVGHYLGNLDEYAGAEVDETLNADGARKGIDANSIMGQNMTRVKSRHFRLIATAFGQFMMRQYGRAFTFDVVAP